MTTYPMPLAERAAARRMLSKVPEITLWFWIIKILCTTVGESFADWISMNLGVGLANTAWLFTGVLAAVLTVQMRLNQYVPAVYWLTVVVLSITGTLYTDILTDTRGVPLRVSSTVFGLLLAVVFGAWYARERTLSIHSITTPAREAFYWFAVLVTFALGTATGDWTLELTGWGPGRSVLLPAALIATVVVGRLFGGSPVLAFWLAYILTRPLGANIGDWLATPRSEQGLGLGTAGTSVLFLVAIAATVAYLTRSRVDTATTETLTPAMHQDEKAGGARVALGLYLAAAVATALLLHHTAGQPHASALADEEGTAVSTVQLTPEQATAAFPATDLTNLRTIGQNLDTAIASGDQSTALAAAGQLESTWDQAQPRLQPLDDTAWTFIDTEIDHVLTAVRAGSPEQATEKQAVATLLATLG